MRVNVYAEELTDRVEIVRQRDRQQRLFYGVRFYLDSPSSLHQTATDDDSSAVTFWVPWTVEKKHDFAKVINVLADAQEVLNEASVEEQSS